PSTATLTNATGLPILTGVSGLGSGVATALAYAGNSLGGIIPAALMDGFRVQAYGAKGDYQTFGDGAMTAGSGALASTNATFSANDVGKAIWVFYAGAP